MRASPPARDSPRAGRQRPDLYNTSTGQLYYDADGSGAGAAQLVATLDGAPALAATDIAAARDLARGPSPYEVMTVLDHGPSDNRVDIVFMGDGYTAAQINTGYLQDVGSLISYMFDGSELTQPFARYQSFFNIHVVEVVSNESGADHPGISHDTALGATYGGSLVVDDAAALRVLNDAIWGTGLEAEMRFIAVNDAQYGGSGGDFAVYAAGNVFALDDALHEVGHQFAGLADQYWTLGQDYSGAEVTRPDLSTDPSGSKWAPWLGYDQPGIGIIGAYEGGAGSKPGCIHPPRLRRLEGPGTAFRCGRLARLFILKFYELASIRPTRTSRRARR